MDTRCFVYFPSNRAGKNRSHQTMLPSTKCRGNRSLESQTIVILGHRPDTRARWTGVCSPLNLRTPVRSSPRHDSLFLHGAEKPLKNEGGKRSYGFHVATFLKRDDRLPAQHLILHLRRGEAPGRWKSWAGCRTGMSLVNEILDRCLTVLAWPLGAILELVLQSTYTSV